MQAPLVFLNFKFCKQNLFILLKPFGFSSDLVGTSGLEPPTSRLSGVRSNHLSYAPMAFKWLPHSFPCGFRHGGDEEDRTPDPLLAKQVLSQLSYTPIQGIRFHLMTFFQASRMFPSFRKPEN